MALECIFSVELFCKILYDTDPRDIVRWRTVSKWFRTITDDAILWKALYVRATFPRPPGPSPSQSVESLQRTLVKSAQLAHSWTTRPMREVSSIKIHFEGQPSVPPKLLCGRWLISCDEMCRFVLHDVNAGDETHGRQVLWEEKESEVSSWYLFSTEPVKGQFAVYLLVQFWNLPRWKLLEFRLNDQSGELCYSVSMHHPASSQLRGIEIQGGKSPFFFIPAIPRGVVFDTRTRVFYEVPPLRVELDETLTEMDPSCISMDYRMAFTDTHVIYLWYFWDHWGDNPTVIQVFTLSPDGSSAENGNPVLRLTHEGIVQTCVLNAEVLKPSVDPATGATKLTLLDHFTRRRCVLRIDLTLPKPSAADVLPMTIKKRSIGFPQDDDGALQNRYEPCFQYVDVSEDGHVRGFFRGIPRDLPGRMGNDHIIKFTIDTTQDQWVIAYSKLSPPEWNNIENTGRLDNITFDGMRGRLCFVDLEDFHTIAVVDIE